MCGIAGIWHPDGRTPDAAALVRMARALTHRGPDEEGFHTEAGVGLGHRRLSIIDLTGGRQPLCNEDESIWVSFNGEIFNYLELREDLESRGHRFKTRTDTETLVHLYEEKGLDFVHHLNGQFAFALWDRRRQRLVLVRDRVGIRPLFYTTLGDGTVLFGSEIKSLLAHGGLRAEIDPVALGQIATLWVPVPPRTAFRGVEELPPGRMLVMEGSRRQLRQYWRPTFPAQHEYQERSFTHWSERVRETLDDAVRLQLRSDVPVAAYLSGGLDSSILASLMKRYHGAPSTFSVGFTDARFDERRFQAMMIDRLGTDHHQIDVSPEDVGAAFGDVVWMSETPIIRTAPAPLYELARLVRRQETKVVLTGEGADEIFGGYNVFREDKVRRYWAGAPSSRRRAALINRLYPYIARDPKAARFWEAFFRSGLEQTADPYYSHRPRWSGGAQLKRFLAPDVVAQMQSDEALFAELDSYLGPGREHWHPLCRAQQLEMTLFMSGYLLSSQGDRMMMAHSVEGRVPFLDHRLIELAAEIPPKFKIRGLDEKFILKHTFRDLLPTDIRQRPKQPYRAPISASFQKRASNLPNELLRTRDCGQSELVNPAAVTRLLGKVDAAGTALSEREEMALALSASVRLLEHHFLQSATERSFEAVRQ